jgi:hypothetical protein
MTSGEHVISRQCPACRCAVPAAVFCGQCGADLEAAVSTFDVLLRPRVFAAAPREPVVVPRLTSSLFPRLPASARKPFRLALVLLLGAMVALSVLGANAALGAITILGGPLLFVLYMWQSDAFRDISRRALVIAFLTGSTLGVAWWLFTGRLLAGSYGVSTAAGLALQNLLAGFGLAVTVGGALILVLPPAVVRLLRVPVHEPMDGYVIGAFGALSYGCAASITWLFPQIFAGLLDAQSSWRMFTDAITYGVIDPLTTAALGGLLGLALWFRPSGRHSRQARTVVTICAVLMAVLFVGIWVVDALSLPHAVEVAANLVQAGVALVLLRVAVQTVLLHETPDPATGDAVLCVHCEKVVPDAPFCVSCGAAARASSRSSRRLRRQCPPVPEFT